MSTTMSALVTELSKSIGDWFEGTVDSGSTTTVVDTALAEKQASWVSSGSAGGQPSTVYIKTDAGLASAAPEGEERNVSGDITVASGTVSVSTVYPFSSTTSVGDTYEIHRLFTRAEKERAIVHGCKASFPHVYKEIQDRSIVFGDWLVNGDFEKWSQSTYPDSWTLATATTTANTTEKYVFGLSTSKSIKFAATGNAGSLYQSEAENNDLWMLAGKTVKFYAWVYSTGGTEVCLGILDGTTTTYGNHTSHSSTTKVYHPGDSTWRLMWVEATIADNPTGVKFCIYYDTSTADAYVDKAHVIADGRYSYDISLIGLYQDVPSQIFYLVGQDASNEIPEASPRRIRIDGSDYGLEPNGKLHFNTAYTSGTRLEIIGLGHLTTPVSTYASGTAVSTEVNDINKEGQIVIAEAAKKLCRDRMHACPTQDIGRWQELYSYWDGEATSRRSKYGMKAMAIAR